jgi:hypothetical protein
MQLEVNLKLVSRDYLNCKLMKGARAYLLAAYAQENPGMAVLKSSPMLKKIIKHALAGDILVDPDACCNDRRPESASFFLT